MARMRRSATSATASGTACPTRSWAGPSPRSPGLIDLGIAPARRVSPLCPRARVDSPTSRSRAPAPSCRSTHQLAERVRGWRQLRVGGDRLRGRRAGGQDRRGAREPARAPHVIAIDPSGDVGGAISPRRPARARPRRDEAEVAAAEAVGARRHVHDHLHLRHHRPPKGCVLSQRNYRQVVNMCEERACSRRATSSTSSSRWRTPTLLIQLLAIDLGGGIAYFGGDPKQIVPELMEVHPTTCRRCRGSSRRSTRSSPPTATPSRSRRRRRRAEGARAAGRRPGGPRRAAGPLRQGRRGAVQERPRNVLRRGAQAGQHGAAPIAKEILEFFYACGVPVMEGYGMTETATVATTQTVEDHRLGRSARRCPAASADRRRRRGPDQGPEHLRRLLQERRRELRHDRRRLAAHRRPRLAGRGRLPLHHRPQKDIIITAGGKNLTPANIENDLKQSAGSRRP